MFNYLLLTASENVALNNGTSTIGFSLDLPSGLIIIAGAVVFGMLISARNRFKKQEDEYKKEVKKSAGENNVEQSEDGDATIVPQSGGIKIKFLEDYEDTYNDNCIFHNMCGQFISLFPMFGLLGTVFGLMKMNLNAIDGLSTALMTTLTGLSLALLLKIMDTLLVSPVSERIHNIIYKHSKEFDNQAKKSSMKDNK